MTEPASRPVRSRTSVNRWRWIAAGIAGLAVLGLAWVCFRGPSGSNPAALIPKIVPESPSVAPSVKAPATTVRSSEPAFHPWPPKAEVVGPPAGSSGPVGVASPARDNAVKVNAPPPARPEPAAPSVAELKDESQRTGDQVTAEGARELLLDDKKSSTLKLAVIDKLKTQDPQEVVPVLVAFLEHPGGSAAAYTKPSAVKVLADLRDPLADQALAKLALTSQDERVRLTIAALKAKEKSR